MDSQFVLKVQRKVKHEKRMKQQASDKKRRDAVLGMTEADKRVDYTKFLKEIPNNKLRRR